jgi:hypothetical protein
VPHLGRTWSCSTPKASAHRYKAPSFCCRRIACESRVRLK